MTHAYVVDTNIGVVANHRWEGASPACIAACVKTLLTIKDSARIAIDDSQLILTEYVRQLSLSGKPGAGDAFMKWVWDNRFNDERRERTAIHPRENPKGPDFEEFPVDQDLAGFDHSDRKFAAVAIASPSRPVVMNAVDSDWWHFRAPLERHGIRVEFVCGEVFGSKPDRTRRGRSKRKR